MSILLLTMGPQLSISMVTPDLNIGNPGTIVLRAVGAAGSVTWTLLSSSLPTPEWGGLVSSGATATLNAANVLTPGAFTIRVRAVDSFRQPVEAEFTVRVQSLPITITGSLSEWTVGVAASDDLAVAGGSGTYVSAAIAAGSLPAGMGVSLIGSTLRVSGTPAAVGSGSVTIWVRDSDGAEGTIALAWSASAVNQVGFVDVSATAIVTDTTMQVGRPSGVAVGDRLLATIVHRSALTPPAGWALVRSDTCTNGTSTQYLSVYSRVADAGDVVQAFYVWEQAASGRMLGVISAWRGDHSTPIVTSVGGHSTSNDAGPQNNQRTLYPAAAQSGSICVACATSILSVISGATTISVYGSQLTLISAAAAQDLRVAVLRGDYVSAGDMVQWGFTPGGNNNGTAASTVRLS